ncbi:unnamed protein product [Malus baccata var. baccata]
MVKQILAKTVELADQVTKALDVAVVSSEEKESVPKLKSKTRMLAGLLRQFLSRDLSVLDSYGRLQRLLINGVEGILSRFLSKLLKRCPVNCTVIDKIKLFFTTTTPLSDFRNIPRLLDNSIQDVSWILHLIWNCEYEYSTLPPIASNELILFIIWEQIAILRREPVSLECRSDAACALGSLVRDDCRNAEFIVEEGGVEPLLKLVQEGTMEEQENAARTLGLLALVRQGVERMIHAGVFKVFAKILREAPMKVQVVVAWAVSMLADEHPECQHGFAQHDVVPLLVNYLAPETDSDVNVNDDHATMAEMKAMAATALWKLAKGNSVICHSLSNSGALLYFAMLLEKGSEDVRFYSAEALMEIAAVAENNAELRRSALSSNSPAWKYVGDQLLIKITDKADPELVTICIKAVGNLAWAFGATETRMIDALVGFLQETEDEMLEACLALTKFVRPNNYFRHDFSNQIVRAGGAMQLIQLLYFERRIIQIRALALICNIAPEIEELTRVEMLTALKWASNQSYMTQDETLNTLLQKAKSRLNLPHQSRGSRGCP